MKLNHTILKKPVKKILLLIACLGGCLVVSAQFTYKIKADTLLVTNDSCSAELALENSTKATKGFLYNYGNGRTRFVPSLTKLNDTTWIIGVDTMRVQVGTTGAFINNQFSSAQPSANLWISGSGRFNGEVLVNTNDLGAYPLQVGGSSILDGFTRSQKVQLTESFYLPQDYSTVTYGPSLTENAKLNITQGVSGGANILLQGSQGGGGVATNPYLFFGDNNKAYSAIRGILRGGGGTNTQYGDIAFYTTPNISTTAITERMRLLYNGNLLLGTSADNGNRLRVNGTQHISAPDSGVVALTVEPTSFVGHNTIKRFTGIKIRANMDVLSTGPNKLLHLENISMGGTPYAHNFLFFANSGYTGIPNYVTIPNSGGLVIGRDTTGASLVVPLYVKNPLSTGNAEWTGYFGSEGAGAAYFINDAYFNANDGTPYMKYGVRIKSTGAAHNNATNAATNIGLFIEAKDADINYGLYSNSGVNYMSDKLGIGTNAPVHKLDVNGSTRLQKAVYYNVNTSVANAAYSITDSDNYIELPEITANRVLTLPAASSHTGRQLTIKNKNSSGNQWSFSTAVKDKQDNDLTNLGNDSVYQLISNGTNWVITALY